MLQAVSLDGIQNRTELDETEKGFFVLTTVDPMSRDEYTPAVYDLAGLQKLRAMIDEVIQMHCRRNNKLDEF